MANSRQDREESVGSQQVDQFVNLQRRRDREANRTPNIRVEIVYSDHISRSYSRLGSHISHEEQMKNLRLEIDHLCKWLRRRVHARGDRTPPSSQSFDSEENHNYKQRSRTPPSESLMASSHIDCWEMHYKRRNRKSSGYEQGLVPNLYVTFYTPH